jgi:SAM-dependent methyltransferase
VAVTIWNDPEGNETNALFDLVELDDREVLEIGCGDGRLTWRYADRAAHVTAIDPFEDAIERAKERLRSTDLPIDFRNVAFEDFATASDADVFDVGLLSCSLRCMEHEGMVHALEQIHRLPRPGGTLIEIHPADVPFVEVRSNGELSFREDDPGSDDEDDLRSAEDAVGTVVARGIFVHHERRRFELRWHASSVREFRDHWALVGA